MKENVDHLFLFDDETYENLITKFVMVALSCAPRKKPCGRCPLLHLFYSYYRFRGHLVPFNRVF
jgi:hypothetical protein